MNALLNAVVSAPAVVTIGVATAPKAHWTARHQMRACPTRHCSLKLCRCKARHLTMQAKPSSGTAKATSATRTKIRASVLLTINVSRVNAAAATVMAVIVVNALASNPSLANSQLNR